MGGGTNSREKRHKTNCRKQTKKDYRTNPNKQITTKTQAYLAFIDLKKAFDNVSRNKL